VFNWAASITSEWFTSPAGCDISGLAWSTNGQYLYVFGPPYVATVAVTPLLNADARAPVGTVTSHEVSSRELQTFTPNDSDPFIDNANLQMLLTPAGDTLLYTAGEPERLMSYNLRTHQLTTLLTLPANFYIQAMTWLLRTPQLLLVVGGDPCVDCGSYAESDVYLYSFSPSPPSSPVPDSTATIRAS
jgi:hypothetical protein